MGATGPRTSECWNQLNFLFLFFSPELILYYSVLKLFFFFFFKLLVTKSSIDFSMLSFFFKTLFIAYVNAFTIRAKAS